MRKAKNGSMPYENIFGKITHMFVTFLNEIYLNILCFRLKVHIWSGSIAEPPESDQTT